MMKLLRYYETTETEKWIEELYRSNDVLVPSDITIQNISSCLGVPVFSAPGLSEELIRDKQLEDFFVIYLDSNKSPEQQKESFLHELCHGLRHVGNQVDLPDGLRQMQEEQAMQFVLLAAMPLFMIRQLDIPKIDRDLICVLATEFGVTFDLAARRLNQIKNRIYYGQAREQFVEKLRNQYSREKPQVYSAETLRLLDQLQRQTMRNGE